MTVSRRLLLASLVAPLALTQALNFARADDAPTQSDAAPATEAAEQAVKEEAVQAAEQAASEATKAASEAAPVAEPETAPAPAEAQPEPAPATAEPPPEPTPEAVSEPAPEPVPEPIAETPATTEPTPTATPEPVPEPPPVVEAVPEPAPAPAEEVKAVEPQPAPAAEESAPAPTAEEPAPATEAPAPSEASPAPTPESTGTAEQPPAEPKPSEASVPPVEPAPAEQPTEPKPAEASAPASEPAKTPSEAASEPLLPPPAPNEPSVTETQLKVQGDAKEAENLRRIRERLKEEQAAVQQLQATEPLPATPTEGKASAPAEAEVRDGAKARASGDNERDRRRREHHHRVFSQPEDVIIQDLGPRTIVRRGDQLMIQQDESTETDRLLYRAEDVDIERLSGGRTRTTVTRADGTQIITERDRYGDVIARTRIDERGRAFVLFDNSEFYRDDEPRERRRYDYDEELPELSVRIPRDEYVVETRKANRRAIRRAIDAPPVEEAERAYAVEEVRMNRRIRDKVRRIDLNDITFDTGSSALSPTQFRRLRVVAEAIEGRLNEHPDDLFLIEGHTDAVGTEYSNLLLSDRRAEAVAVALSSNFDIPPENLVTQGYGEEFLKVDTPGPERENRRVAVRRITELVRNDR